MHFQRSSGLICQLLLLGVVSLSLGLGPRALDAQIDSTRPRPNVILIMTDDQGLGDFGCMGNPLVKTPNIDQLFQQSGRVSHFYVSPVCSPTRASLMTGRYHYRTRVVDTFIGRSMMDTNEVTLAERFQASGYRTGIFGKWHLGDCYPMRPVDQGFERSVVHRGGGIGQSSDPIGAEGDYTDPILFHEGEPVQESGYCTDVYYDYAIDYIRQCHQKQQPFFVYLADNCPHGPFDDVPDDWWSEYQDLLLPASAYPQVPGGVPIRKSTNQDKNRRVYSMISNIDENIGRLQQVLQELSLEKNTIVIFLTDNGPNGERYTCGLRGRKTSVYEGGIRTLFLMKWPGQIPPGSTVDTIAAHIDVTPTLIDACGLSALADAMPIDGVNLLPKLTGNAAAETESQRNLFFQVHRGNEPQRYHHFAVRGPRYKLVHHSGFGKESFDDRPELELFDLKQDPFEQTNLVDDKPDIVKQMVQSYDRWFDDVSSTRPDNFEAPRIVIAPSKENPLVLTRQDARRIPGTIKDQWALRDHWRLTNDAVRQAEVTVYFNSPVTGNVSLWVGEREWKRPLVDIEKASFKVTVGVGNVDLRAYCWQGEADAPIPAYQLHLKWVE